MVIATQQPHLLSPLTAEDLGRLQVHLPALKIFSYRGPGESGGVASSLAPLTKQLGTKVQWIALSGVPSQEDNPIAGFSFHRPELAEDMLAKSGKAVQNYLWPLFHGISERAHFDAEEWKNFKQLSLTLAHQSQKVVSRSFPTLIWLHDFEMVLLAPMLSMDAGVILAHFWHVPWPAPETIVSSPVGLELTEALLSNKLLGFHTAEYADNFLNTVCQLVPQAQVDLQNRTVVHRGHTVQVVAMPLGLDYTYWQRLARSTRAQAEAIPVSQRLAQQIVLGVDRLDYTKGVLEKLNGLELFLKTNPDLHRRFHYVQLAQPAPGDCPELLEYAALVRNKARQLNEQFKKDSWEPVIWMEGHFNHSQLSAWYQAADVLAVTPLRDGLNLIAKEYIACRQDEQGVLVLSDTAGCAVELVSGAELVDPLSPESVANAFVRALTLEVEEKRRRMVSMRHVVAWNRLHDWACGFLHQAIGTGSKPAC